MDETARDSLRIHHLVRSAAHIIGVLENEEYYQQVRGIEWSQTAYDYSDYPTSRDNVRIGGFSYCVQSRYKQPQDLVEGRHCLSDLKAIVDIIAEYDEKLRNNQPITEEFRESIKLLKREMEPYRAQRKLSFKSIRIRNSDYQGNEETQPQYHVLSHSLVRFEVGDIPGISFR